MGVNEYKKFSGGSQDKGLSNFEPSIGAEIAWNNDTVNVSGGIRRGVGPRYGIAPLAGHSNTETPAGTATNGIQRSEITSGSVGLTFRETIYGIVPITMAPYDGAWPKPNKQFYCYLVGLDYSSNVSLDACLGATLSSGVNKQANTFVAGLATSSYRQENPLVRLHKTELLNLPQGSTPTAASMQAILEGVPGRYWMPYSHISVSGKRIPYQWMFAQTTSTPNATTAPTFSLWSKTVSVGTNPTILGGSPSEIITREFSANNERLLTVYCLDDDGYEIDLGYTRNINQNNTLAGPAYAAVNNYNGFSGSTKFGASTAYSSVAAVIANDPGSYTNSRHEAVLFAGETPVAVIYQDWLQAANGMMPRWVDLTNIGCTPRYLSTFEDKPSASPNPNSTRNRISGTGFLRIDIKYDIGFSYYNKLLDYETNVSFLNSVQTGIIDSKDNYAVLVDAVEMFPSSFDATPWMSVITTQNNTAPWEFSNSSPASGAETGRGFHINDYEIRFYYRNSGIGDWLPAGSFDLSDYWFRSRDAVQVSENAMDPLWKGVSICTGASGYNIGGQPNGFNDYSPLPKQRYICTTVFQQRAFWWSEKDMRFSYQNNIYAYALRNVVACQTGKWRGGIVHVRTNLNQQSSRLVVFGDTTYSCRFTGEKYIQNIIVSSNADSVTTGQFPIDGSDFVMDYLCDSTAFSFRSAVVAEGILYWWGPQGIYRDDGLTEPKKISLDLEPNIFNYVDMQRDSEIHCVYNKRSHEIIWFYPPKVADSDFPTYGIVLNVENGKFYPYKFRCQVDSSQNIKIENDETPDGVDGERILLHCRATSSGTIQRTFYFDEVVAAGEQGPNRELTVLSFTSPTADTRRLTLATGSVGITAGDIAADDYICIQNAKGYAPSLTLAPDMIAKVTAVNNASNYIDIELPPGAVWDASATLTGQTAFPIYQRKPAAVGLHGVRYLIDTNYWLPGGLSSSWDWQYFMFLFKYLGIPSPRDPFTVYNKFPESIVSRVTFSHKTLVCDGPSTQILSLINNSSGHCQIHHPLQNENRSANGQALAFALTGIYIGDPWTLEYLEAHCLTEQGFTLKEFEG